MSSNSTITQTITMEQPTNAIPHNSTKSATPSCPESMLPAPDQMQPSPTPGQRAAQKLNTRGDNRLLRRRSMPDITNSLRENMFPATEPVSSPPTPGQRAAHELNQPGSAQYPRRRSITSNTVMYGAIPRGAAPDKPGFFNPVGPREPGPSELEPFWNDEKMPVEQKCKDREQELREVLKGIEKREKAGKLGEKWDRDMERARAEKERRELESRN